MGEYIDSDYRLYCAMDALATRHVAPTILKELSELNLVHFYNEIVHPLARLLSAMNRRGIWVDQAAREPAIASLQAEIDEAQGNLNTIAEREMPVNGDKLGNWLFGELKAPCAVRSVKTGKWGVDKIVLGNIAEKAPEFAPIVELIITVRKREKLISTFLDAAGDVDENGRLHPNYKIGPVTGRLSCKRPNLQNIPEGLCRSVYSAPPGKLFVGGDYSQVELKIFAILSKSEYLLEQFAKGVDAHHAFGMALVGDEELVRKRRKFVKNFVFGMIFGGQEPTLRRAISSIYEEPGRKVSEAVVTEAMNRFFKMNPQARLFMNQCKTEVATKRRMVNNFGRPRVFFGDIKDALGQGGNYKMQSGAADLTNTRMLVVDKEMPETLIIQVHDFMMLEVDEDKAEESATQLKEIMEAPCKEFGGYSFSAKVKVGKNWSMV